MSSTTMQSPRTLDLAVQSWQQGRFPQTVDLCRRILSSKRRDAAALHLMGLALWELGRHEESLECLSRAAKEGPRNADVHGNLGNVLQRSGRMEEAAHSLRRALDLDPDRPSRMNLLGDALVLAGRPEEGLPFLLRAAAREPECPKFRMNLGLAQGKLGRWSDALAEGEAAVRLAPSDAEAWQLLAWVHHMEGRFRAQRDCLERALTCDPHDPKTHFSLAGYWLAEGAWLKGWEEYEWRFRTGYVDPWEPPVPAWDGRPDQAVLVCCEQGFGDTLQFVRYLSLLRPRVGRLLFLCQEPLARLLEDFPGVDVLLTDRQDPRIAEARAHIPLLSLPRLFETTPDTVPASPAYLQAPPQLAARWRERLGAREGTRVGLVWAGSPAHSADNLRSMRLETMAALACVPGVTFYSLQKGPAAMQALQPPPGMRLVDLTADLADFADTAALIESLDLVLGVDTSVVHLAAALGKPTWSLHSQRPDWRWLREGDSTPWYPSMRLFRQTELGEWADVVERAARALETVARGEALGAAAPPSIAPILSETDRRKQVITRGQTDVERWSDPSQLERGWDRRAERVAELFVPAGAGVLDIGCGRMSLELHLPSGCTYLPADVVARDERTRVCDLNQGRMPDSAGASLVTMLGVLEYVYDVPATLARLRAWNLPVVLTYCPADQTSHLDRRALGWVNDLTSSQLVEAVEGAGFGVRSAERIDDIQVALRLEPGGRPPIATKRVLVLSYNSVGNFGDRLGYHLVNEVLPASTIVRHATFKPWSVPDEDFDLLIVGIGNSVVPSMLTDDFWRLVERVPSVVGIFGTQYRAQEDPAALARLIDRLDVWFARYQEDVALYGQGRDNVVHLGDWLIPAFPMAEGRDPECLEVGDWIWEDLPLDRTIQRIQSHRRVFSTRLHPLLCALTSAEEVAYREQRETGAGVVSGKFRSMLMDVFGRTWPEDQIFPVDRHAVAAYKRHVQVRMEHMRRVLRALLGMS